MSRSNSQSWNHLCDAALAARISRNSQTYNLGMPEDMLGALTTFYKDNRIYSCEFDCQQLDSCQQAAEAFATNSQFTTATSAYVGTEYERGLGPRVLFISLDPGKLENNDRIDYARTPEGVRARVLRDGLKPQWVHWVWTHELLAAILAQCKVPLDAAADFQEIRRIDEHRPAVPRDRKKVDCERLKDLVTLTPYFAHVNSAKCCLNLPGGSQASSKLYRNCQGYLGGEIEKLKPKIIVTQGRMAYAAFWHSLSSAKRSLAGELGKWYDPSPYRTLTLSGNRVLWLPTYHPSYPRKRYDWQKYWQCCIRTCATLTARFLGTE